MFPAVKEYFAQREFSKLRRELGELDKELEKLQAYPDPIERFVALFKVLSSWHKAEERILNVASALSNANLNGRNDYKLKQLYLLKDTIHFTRRDPLGFNRAPMGAEVASDHIFLGGTQNLPMFSVSVWREEFKQSRYPESRSVIEAQAGQFISANLPKLRKAIKGLNPSLAARR